MVESAVKSESDFLAWQNRMAAGLNALLNNTQEMLSPPMPTVYFTACGDPSALCYVGKLSASQYDRLNHIARAAGMKVSLAPSREHGDQPIFRVETRGGDLVALEGLVAHEPQRRESLKEATPIMQRMTELDWCWDGLCFSAPYPAEENHPAHLVLSGFLNKGIIRESYDLSVLDGRSVCRAVG